jgi:RNA-directed DNA polymerase
VSFCPAISNKAAKNIRHTIKNVWKLKNKIAFELKGLATTFNTAIQGWINYYSRFHGSALYSGVFDYLNTMLMKWAMQKFKNLRRRPSRASAWLKKMQLQNPNLFAHWKFSMTGNDRLIRAV